MRTENWNGQPVDEIRAALAEEGCLRCFGCPAAMLAAAGLVHRSAISRETVEFTFELGGPAEHLVEWIAETEAEIESYRDELAELTAACTGFTGKVPGRRPSMMCQSPAETDSQLRSAGGWLVDIITLRALKRIKLGS